MNKFITSKLIFIGIVTAWLSGQGTQWEFDMAHSKISFDVTHMVISHVEGRFGSFTGSVEAGKDDFSDAKTTITIDTATINTDNDRRDGHLRSPDFFDVEKYPEITFVSTNVRKSGKNSYLLTGDLIMHGATKPVELNVQHLGTILDPRGNTRAGFKVKGTINRTDWGLTYNSIMDSGGFVISENIDINGNVELIRK